MAEKITTLYARLRPLIQRDFRAGDTVINNYITEDSGGGTTVSGVPTTRQVISGAGLTGGGDLSNDRTLVVGAGDGITVGADSISLSTSVAGNGLTYTTGVLDVVSANTGIAVGANNLTLTLAANPGLEISSGLKMGTPGTNSVSSTNALSGTTHTHAITASDDVYNAGAGVAAILKSSSAGGLVLRSLNVRGSVDITDGGDLTVGSNVLFVDVSLGSIGVNRSPDPQFAMDVNGPLRATYLIGKHAIQLDHALLLCHYDGDPKGYAGEFNGLNGRIGTTTGVHFLPGKFGKSAVRSSATVNLITNPSFENGTAGTTITGWVTAQTGTGASWVYTNAISHTGALAAQVRGSSVGNAALINPSSPHSLATGITVYGSVWVYREEAHSGYIGIRNATSTAILAQTNFDVSGSAVLHEWVEYTVEYTNPGAAVNVDLYLSNTAGSGTLIWFDSAALYGTAGAGAVHPYFDGNCENANWTGVANASTSSITPSHITYTAAGNLDRISGTIMMWVRPYGIVSARWLRVPSTSDVTHLIQIGTSAGGEIFAQCSGTTSGNIQVLSGITAVPRTWYHIAMTYTQTLVSIYVNGELEGSYVPTEPFQPGATDQIQVLYANAAQIDDLVTTADVLNANLIRSIYESDAPVFAESSVFSFRATVNGLVWGDEEGLWMRNFAGDAVLGVYGGEAGAKSWGGQSLDTGDLLIGRSAQYVKWDDSAGTLTVSGAINVIGTIPNASIAGLGDLALEDDLDGVPDGSSYARVNSTIISAGNIRVGSGTKDVNLAGFHIGSTEIVGQSASAPGVDQTVMNTSGQITAGAGNVILSADGITIEGVSDYEDTWLTFRDSNAGSTVQVATIGSMQLEFGEVTAGFIDHPGVALTYTQPDGDLVGMIAVTATRDANAGGNPANTGSWTYTNIRTVAVTDWFTIVPPSGYSAYTPRLSFAAGASLAQIVTDQSMLSLTGSTGVHMMSNKLRVTSGGVAVNRGGTNATEALDIDGKLKTGVTSNNNLGYIMPPGSFTIANGATVDIGNIFGKLLLLEDTGGFFAEFVLRGSVGATVEISDHGGVFSITSGTATSTNVYWNAGTTSYRIQNNRGASRVYYAIVLARF